ncbi:MAG: methyltransferase domain-containing protein [bacterium]|nr:methyltransferase domain-containing protein [bacterium]
MPAKDKWEFDESVTNCFDDMLRRSIPQYDVMRSAVFNLGTHYVQRKSAIFDLGCSRGEAIAEFVRKYGAMVRYHGVEVSQPMLKAARERFAGMIDTGLLQIHDMDLRHKFPMDTPSLILSVFTLQFVPINYRQAILDKCYDALLPGGAMILVEKILGSDGKIDNVLVDEYHQLKVANGYSKEEVDRKALSLEGVLVPVTAQWNEDMLHKAGFSTVDCFWRLYNFAGWIAVKKS